jgi:hypothetical protein
MRTRLGQLCIGVGRYLGFLPKTQANQTPLVPNPAHTIIVQPAKRFFLVGNNMILQADSIRPGASPVFSLDIRKDLALTNDTILSVETDIEVASGIDDSVSSRLVGSPSFTDTIISQRVAGAISGVAYDIKFNVTTPQQVLSFVVNIPVDDEGAFVSP